MKTLRFVLSLPTTGLAWVSYAGLVACDSANVLFWSLTRAIRGD